MGELGCIVVIFVRKQVGEVVGRLGETAFFMLRWWVFAALLTAGGLVLVSVPAQAAGRPGAPVPAAAAAATSQATLSAVSCTAASSCMAVGTLITGSPGKDVTLAESWNGTAWTMKATPNPKGATGSFLFGVSCTAASRCMAVGLYEDAAAPLGVPFAEVWNGTAWTIKTMPSPPGTTPGADGVSCATAQACIAVGNVVSNGHNNAFSEAWNGTAWTLKTTPRPTGTTYSLLNDASCRSATFCMATGDYQVNNSSKSRTLAELWNGKIWAIEATPNPKDGVNGAELPGVACSSSLACVAVGGYDSTNNQGNLTLAEAWNGKTWAIKATPNPQGAAGNSLLAVSCTAANGCMAVGDSGANGIFSELWNGTAWTIKAVPHPQAATFVFMNGVSCGAANSCVAVGDYFNSSQAELPVAEAWNGTAWTIKPVPF